ncbi:MAG: hypothetical protein ABW250_18590, partial [Pyrinomonadaceae bacterium]
KLSRPFESRTKKAAGRGSIFQPATARARRSVGGKDSTSPFYLLSPSRFEASDKFVPAKRVRDKFVPAEIVWPGHDTGARALTGGGRASTMPPYRRPKG